MSNNDSPSDSPQSDPSDKIETLLESDPDPEGPAEPTEDDDPVPSPTTGDDRIAQPNVNVTDSSTIANPGQQVPDEVDASPRFWPGDILDESEEVIEAKNPDVIKSIPAFIGGGIAWSLALFLLVVHVTGQTGALLSGIIPFVTVGAPSWWLYVPLFFILLGVVIAGTEFYRRKITWYIITDQAIYIRRNIATPTVRNFRPRDITQLEVYDPVWLSYFGTGHIKIYTPSSDGHEEMMGFVKNPQQVRMQIRRELGLNQQERTQIHDYNDHH